MEEMKNVTTLNDDEIEVLEETLEENQSEKTKILRNTLNSENEKESNLIPVEVDYSIDPETGLGSIDSSLKKYMEDNDITLGDLESIDTSDIDKIKINKEMILNSEATKDLDISDEEIIELLNFIERYEANEKGFDIYNNMPKFMKQATDKLYSESYGQLKKKEIATIIADNFIKEVKMDQAFLDINNAIKNELRIPSLTELYAEFIKENFEEKLLEVADQVREENPEKAKMLEDISAIYKTTYTFEELINGLNNRKVRQYIKDESRYKKMCSAFNRKYENSRFKISSVDLCYSAIRSCIPELEDEYVKKFIMLFCKVSENKNPDDILDHVFMYYTIQNIRLLQHEDDPNNKRSEMYNTIVENIKKTIEAIKEREKERNSSK